VILLFLSLVSLAFAQSENPLPDCALPYYIKTDDCIAQGGQPLYRCADGYGCCELYTDDSWQATIDQANADCQSQGFCNAVIVYDYSGSDQCRAIIGYNCQACLSSSSDGASSASGHGMVIDGSIANALDTWNCYSTSYANQTVCLDALDWVPSVGFYSNQNYYLTLPNNLAMLPNGGTDNQLLALIADRLANIHDRQGYINERQNHLLSNGFQYLINQQQSLGAIQHLDAELQQDALTGVIDAVLAGQELTDQLVQEQMHQARMDALRLSDDINLQRNAANWQANQTKAKIDQTNSKLDELKGLLSGDAGITESEVQAYFGSAPAIPSYGYSSASAVPLPGDVQSYLDDMANLRKESSCPAPAYIPTQWGSIPVDICAPAFYYGGTHIIRLIGNLLLALNALLAIRYIIKARTGS